MTTVTRRRALQVGLGLAASAAVLAASGAVLAVRPAVTGRQAATSAQTTSLRQTTPALADVDADDDEPLTPSQTEGPYFKPNSPERTSLVDPGMPGTPLVITGRVLAPDGQPVAGALLDFWQADDSGAYDNVGYTLRGHQLTDDNGQYRLETIVPGLYPGRTRHIHVKVQAPNGPVLTTQLYFPNEPRNATDGIFNPALVLPIEATDSGESATFDFVINLS
jgi:protocatechuate 3,4-dioxygenase beta subunit